MSEIILSVAVTAAILAWCWISEKAHRKRMENLRRRFPWLDV